MCRSIITLRGPDAASDEEVRAAALQFVRKVSGYRKPSKANTETFDRAVEEVAVSVRHLLDGLTVPAPARSAPSDRPATAAPTPSRDGAVAR